MHLDRRATLLGSLALATTPAARAQTAADYPSRSIRMLVGFPPAGTTDIAARLYSERLAARLVRHSMTANHPPFLQERRTLKQSAHA